MVSSHQNPLRPVCEHIEGSGDTTTCRARPSHGRGAVEAAHSDHRYRRRRDAGAAAPFEKAARRAACACCCRVRCGAAASCVGRGCPGEEGARPPAEGPGAAAAATSSGCGLRLDRRRRTGADRRGSLRRGGSRYCDGDWHCMGHRALDGGLRGQVETSVAGARDADGRGGLAMRPGAAAASRVAPGPDRRLNLCSLRPARVPKSILHHRWQGHPAVRRRLRHDECALRPLRLEADAGPA
mmetsp:Transcript_8848/g.22984  ORF Transcript_8848/g.22984 Transcript_8848/m.22984 type:complete len:240 (-) Transcript_8848:3093-3812(-)